MPLLNKADGGEMGESEQEQEHRGPSTKSEEPWKGMNDESRKNDFAERPRHDMSAHRSGC